MTEQQLAAMRQALGALESYHGYMEPLTTVFGGPRVPAEQSTTGKVEKAITALRTAITEAESRATEQAEKQRSANEHLEPVAWMVDVDIANYQGQSEYRTILAWNAKPVWTGTHEINEVLKAVPLYTRPQPTAQFAGSYGTIDESAAKRIATALGWKPAAQWVGLTDEELHKLWRESPFRGSGGQMDWFTEGARVAEAKLREKNGGKA